MTDEEFLVQLREAFVVEAAGHLQGRTGGLLELEKAPAPPRRAELVETVFREAHSLKGAARAVNRTDIESVCQALESVFSQWKKDAGVAPGSFDLLNRAIDLVTRLLRMPDVATGAADRTAITNMVRDLGSAPAPETSAPEPSAPSAPPPPPPAPTESQPAAPAADETPQLAETVRIPMVKMDALLRQAEEMIAVKLIVPQRRRAARARRRARSVAQARGKVRDVTRGSGSEPGGAAKLADFLEWNQSYMRSVEKRVAAPRTLPRLTNAASARSSTTCSAMQMPVMLLFATLLDLFPNSSATSPARKAGSHAQPPGREVEIDKRILQEIKDPLIHLVRNSIDHGIEKPADRAAAHKPATGRLTLAVSQLDGSKVEIVFADDGAGIDVEKVKASAVRAGALREEDASALSEQAALALIFNSGISTSPIITEISGRGLGMAIVREKVRSSSARSRSKRCAARARRSASCCRSRLPRSRHPRQRGRQSFVIPRRRSSASRGSGARTSARSKTARRSR